MLSIVAMLVLCGLFILGLYLCNNYDFEFLGLLISVISGFIILMAFIFTPINYYSTISGINQYNSMKNTIEITRNQNISEIERAALTTKIIETNQWLIDVQYWNNTIFDYCIPDEIMQLEPLK